MELLRQSEYRLSNEVSDLKEQQLRARHQGKVAKERQLGEMLDLKQQRLAEEQQRLAEEQQRLAEKRLRQSIAALESKIDRLTHEHGKLDPTTNRSHMDLIAAQLAQAQADLAAEKVQLKGNEDAKVHVGWPRPMQEPSQAGMPSSTPVSPFALWEHMNEVTLTEIRIDPHELAQDERFMEFEAGVGGSVKGRMVLMEAPMKPLYSSPDTLKDSPFACIPTRLVIRDQAIVAASVVIKALKEQLHKRLEIIGIPGIGKTMWSNYLLKLCYDENIVVVQHDLATGNAMLLVSGEPAVELPRKAIDKALKRYADRHPLYLCDTGKNATFQPVLGETFIMWYLGCDGISGPKSPESMG